LSESFRVKKAERRKVDIPKFYLPFGNKNLKTDEFEKEVQQSLDKVRETFESLPGGNIARTQHMDKITEACNCPTYWRKPLFNAVGGHRAGQITKTQFLEFWEYIIRNYHDEASKFVAIVETQRKNSEQKQANNEGTSWQKSEENKHFLEFHDFMPIIQDIVDTHPGLSFLVQAPEFHMRYVQTVICRIFYNVNRSWSGRISISELRMPMGQQFLQSLAQLSETPDINQFTWFFSYEHFYVIYCRFWDLDQDHDLIISASDLLQYQTNGYSSLTSKIVDRLLSGCVTRWPGSKPKERTMEYRDFVCFLLAENDKEHPTSIEYWFRVLDIDGDGYLSLYELEHFYDEQCDKLQSLEIEPLAFEDIACLGIDSINCHDNPLKITLSELKRCKNATHFLDTFINTVKYLEFEQNEPTMDDVDEEDDKLNKVFLPYYKQRNTPWVKYCNDEYQELAYQEQNAME